MCVSCPGHAPYPLWYTRNDCGTAATGDPEGTRVYMPYEVDCTLQYADSWFYQEGVGYKSVVVSVASSLHPAVGLLRHAPELRHAAEPALSGGSVQCSASLPSACAPAPNVVGCIVLVASRLIVQPFFFGWHQTKPTTFNGRSSLASTTIALAMGATCFSTWRPPPTLRSRQRPCSATRPWATGPAGAMAPGESQTIALCRFPPCFSIVRTRCCLET